MHDEAMKADSVREDDELTMTMRDRMIGASQQATFHRIEAEKHERIARGAAALIAQLEDTRPVAHLDPDDVYTRAVKDRESSSPSQPSINTSLSGQTAQGPVLAH